MYTMKMYKNKNIFQKERLASQRLGRIMCLTENFP